MNFGGGYGQGAAGGMGMQQQNMQFNTDASDSEVQHPFTDSISCIKFAPSVNPVYQNMGTMFAAAGWDGNVSLSTSLIFYSFKFIRLKIMGVSL